MNKRPSWLITNEEAAKRHPSLVITRQQLDEHCDPIMDSICRDLGDLDLIARMTKQQNKELRIMEARWLTDNSVRNAGVCVGEQSAAQALRDFQRLYPDGMHATLSNIRMALEDGIPMWVFYRLILNGVAIDPKLNDPTTPTSEWAELVCIALNDGKMIP